MMKRITLHFDEKNGIWPSIDGQRIDGVIKAVLTNSRDGGRLEIVLDAKYCDLDFSMTKAST